VRGHEPRGKSHTRPFAATVASKPADADPKSALPIQAQAHLALLPGDEAGVSKLTTPTLAGWLTTQLAAARSAGVVETPPSEHSAAHSVPHHSGTQCHSVRHGT
jgi:hypothetical protein